MGKPFASLVKPASSPRGRDNKDSSGGLSSSKVARSASSMSCRGGGGGGGGSSSQDRAGTSGLGEPADFSAAYAVDSCPFSARQLKKLKDAFDFFDIDNDGRISGGELRKVLRFLGSRVSEEEALKIIAEVDLNCNGTVEFNEFVNMMAEYHRRSHSGSAEQLSSAEEAEILEAFQAFDHNGDSYIDFAELKKTMKFLGEGVTDEDVECMIREADIDLDGRIDFDEFKKLLASMKRGF